MVGAPVGAPVVSVGICDADIFAQTPFVNYYVLKWFLLTPEDDTKTAVASPKA
jgi:hypothetical protein